MFMQRIRRATYKHRKLLIVVVAVLCIGMVSSFAYWNSDSNKGGSSTEVSAADQVAAYETYIADNEPADMSSVDYGGATGMASMYMQLSEYCLKAYSEALAAGSAQAADYSARSRDAAAKAAAYYLMATDLAPDTMNDLAIAQLYTNRANALFYAGELDQARALFEEAVAKEPDEFSVHGSYAGFIFNVDGLEAAEAYLNAYMAELDTASENYASAEELLNRYRFLNDVYGMGGGATPAEPEPEAAAE